MRHFLTLRDFTKEELLDILKLSQSIKSEFRRGEFVPYLEGYMLAMIFEKSSTRTRVSFEAGIYQLGGTGMFLSGRDIQLGRGEPMKDTARVITRMVNQVMIRTTGHDRVEEFARHCDIPVINGLTDDFHPCQLMADYMTMAEHGKDKDPIVTFIGDGHNMANSWMMLAGKLGFELRIASPKGYRPQQRFIDEAEGFATASGGKILFLEDPNEAVEDADVVTTDVWASMGQEEEYQQRMKDFKGYMVDDTMMKRAKEDAIFLHCLPAHREEEVTESVLEGPQSVIFDEAENRLHAQKGIMVWLDRHSKK